MAKGSWIWADALYWFFCLPLTAVIVIALIHIPGKLLLDSINPTDLDAAITEERIIHKISSHTPYTGTDRTEITSDPEKDNSLLLSEKKQGVEITAGEKKVVLNEEFYTYAKPIAKVRYSTFAMKTKMNKEGKAVIITIDQIFPKRYEPLE